MSFIIGHLSLARNARLLHRDMSISNMMLRHGPYPRKGLLIDLQYCTDLAPGDVPQLKITSLFDDKENIAPSRKPIPRAKGKAPMGASKIKDPDKVKNDEKKGYRTVSVILMATLGQNF